MTERDVERQREKDILKKMKQDLENAKQKNEELSKKGKKLSEKIKKNKEKTKEISARTAFISERGMELSEKTKEISEKINDLQDRALKKDHKNKPSVSGAGIIVMVISDLLGGLLLGASLGYIFWQWFGFGKEIFGLFLFLGGIGGFLNLYRYTLVKDKE